MANRFLQDSVAIAPSVRTAIIAPVDCVEVCVTQTDVANDAKVWDAAAAGHSTRLARGGQKRFSPPAGVEAYGSSTFPRPAGFRAGETVCWIEAVAGTGPIALEVTV